MRGAKNFGNTSPLCSNLFLFEIFPLGVYITLLWRGNPDKINPTYSESNLF